MKREHRRKSCKVSLVLGIFIFLTALLTAGANAAQTTDITKASPATATPVASNPSTKALSPQNIGFPASFGYFVDKNTSSVEGAPLVIHIQDLHCNYEAQKNIANIVEYMQKNYGVDTVLLEGASGKVDTTPFSLFRMKNVIKSAAEHFLRKGRIYGVEYLKITNPQIPLELVGIEDEGLYNKNLESFSKNEIDKSAIEGWLTVVNGRLEQLKSKIYSPQLQELDSKINGYNNNTLNLNEFISFVGTKVSENRVDISSAELSNVKKLLDLVSTEKTIDFKAADTDRESLINELSKTLPKETLKEVLVYSVDLKEGKITQLKYYAYLKGLYGSEFDAKFKNLSSYVDYLKLSASIDHSKLTQELVLLEDILKTKLAKSSDEITLTKLSKDIGIIRDLINIALSRSGLQYYKEHKTDFASKTFEDFIARNKNSIANPAVIPSFNLESALAKNDEFYMLATERDKALVDNAMKFMTPNRAVVLISGGFHTAAITSELKNNNISYVVITPKVTGKIDLERYRSLLANPQPSITDLLKVDYATLPLPAGSKVISVKAAFAGNYVANLVRDLSITTAQARALLTLEQLANKEVLLIAGINDAGNLVVNIEVDGKARQVVLDSTGTPVQSSDLTAEQIAAAKAGYNAAKPFNTYAIGEGALLEQLKAITSLSELQNFLPQITDAAQIAVWSTKIQNAISTIQERVAKNTNAFTPEELANISQAVKNLQDVVASGNLYFFNFRADAADSFIGAFSKLGKVGLTAELLNSSNDIELAEILFHESIEPLIPVGTQPMAHETAITTYQVVLFSENHAGISGQMYNKENSVRRIITAARDTAIANGSTVALNADGTITALGIIVNPAQLNIGNVVDVKIKADTLILTNDAGNTFTVTKTALQNPNTVTVGTANYEVTTNVASFDRGVIASSFTVIPAPPAPGGVGGGMTISFAGLNLRGILPNTTYTTTGPNELTLTNSANINLTITAVTLSDGDRYLKIGDATYRVLPGVTNVDITNINPFGNAAYLDFFRPNLVAFLRAGKSGLSIVAANPLVNPDLAPPQTNPNRVEQAKNLLNSLSNKADATAYVENVVRNPLAVISEATIVASSATADNPENFNFARKYLEAFFNDADYGMLARSAFEYAQRKLFGEDWRWIDNLRETNKIDPATANMANQTPGYLTGYTATLTDGATTEIEDASVWRVESVEPLVAKDLKAIPTVSPEEEQELLKSAVAVALFAGDSRRFKEIVGSNRNVSNVVQVQLPDGTVQNLTLAELRLALMLGQYKDQKIVVFTGSGTDEELRSYIQEKFKDEMGNIKFLMQDVNVTLNPNNWEEEVRLSNGELAIYSPGHGSLPLQLLKNKELLLWILQNSQGILCIGNGDGIGLKPSAGIIKMLLDARKNWLEGRRGKPLATVGEMAPMFSGDIGGIGAKVLYINTQTGQTFTENEIREQKEMSAEQKSQLEVDVKAGKIIPFNTNSFTIDLVAHLNLLLGVEAPATRLKTAEEARQAIEKMSESELIALLDRAVAQRMPIYPQKKVLTYKLDANDKPILNEKGERTPDIEGLIVERQMQDALDRNIHYLGGEVEYVLVDREGSNNRFLPGKGTELTPPDEAKPVLDFVYFQKHGYPEVLSGNPIMVNGKVYNSVRVVPFDDEQQLIAANAGKQIKDQPSEKSRMQDIELGVSVFKTDAANNLEEGVINSINARAGENTLNSAETLALYPSKTILEATGDERPYGIGVDAQRGIIIEGDLLLEAPAPMRTLEKLASYKTKEGKSQFRVPIVVNNVRQQKILQNLLPNAEILVSDVATVTNQLKAEGVAVLGIIKAPVSLEEKEAQAAQWNKFAQDNGVYVLIPEKTTEGNEILIIDRLLDKLLFDLAAGIKNIAIILPPLKLPPEVYNQFNQAFTEYKKLVRMISENI